MVSAPDPLSAYLHEVFSSRVLAESVLKQLGGSLGSHREEQQMFQE
jgi:hypothetical protein